ncbi:NACHT domain-containing protein [Solwaraspora sp. WMMD1047]|uniref:NACHT domain-containing protein n=1 Tax=Solwaraspora sp. WMMD1047 TaxID=3016102 RepID=UPI0024170C60|nr:NACHT domain-containing protein [Solwaraspora sp. WMMD1047]MDG4834589.1 NACHT domain-containing protein [Solwaraspora sp. WMMD1047]
MSGLETAAFVLGTAVAKTACGLWLGDHKLANEIGNSFIDHAVARVTGLRQQRQVERIWSHIADLVADRVEPLVETEYRTLPEHERIAAIDAVRDTFAAAALTERDLFRLDLDANYLNRHLRSGDPGRVERAGLSADATALYDRLLQECCLYAIELVHGLPAATAAGFEELLRRERQILDTLAELLTKLASQPGVAEFEGAYRQAVRNRLDRVEFFGASLTGPSRHYPLSVAYLSLTVSGDFPRPPADPMLESIGRLIDTMRDRPRSEGVGTTRVEEVLASSRRVFVRGQAGIGKTTLLQWIAVRSADNSFGDRVSDWNNTVPFFIPLRRYAQTDLPAPEQFLGEVGKNIADGMQSWWVQRLLTDGRAIVLVDGVDELPESRRDEVRRWLHHLIADFPKARYVVTTRPAATPADWLGADDFTVAELEPMTPADVSVFVHRWHEAMRDQCGDSDERDQLTGYENQLLDSIATQRHLRRLAGYPLLCALLCALHRDRHGALPANRMELYRIALEMLLDRRDRGRKLPTTPELDLDLPQKTLLLRDIAYWLVRNGWTSVSVDRAQRRVAGKLRGMAVKAPAPAVFRLLLERSGLLREPVEGQIDFVHRSFQEYLAAAEAAAAPGEADTAGADDIGALARFAHNDDWSEVVVLAAGHATTPHRVELLTAVLDRIDTESGQVADTLRLVALACLDTSPELPPELRTRIEREAARVIPPANMATARAIAKSEFAVDLLVRSRPTGAAEVAATIRAAAEIGDPAALPLLARFGTDRRKSIVRELLRAWPSFDPEEYARTVLPSYPLVPNTWFRVEDARLAPGLRHLTALRDLDFLPTGTAITDLGFVADLPGLTGLYTHCVTDLGPVASTSLEALFIREAPPEAPPLSVAPLTNLGSLRHLDIHYPVTDLHTLPALTSLALAGLGTAARLDELRHLGGLEWVHLVGLPDLLDLRPLDWLDAPEHLILIGCPALADLEGLAGWADSLRHLTFSDCGALDLSALAPLRGLMELHLLGDADLDLARLPELPSLSSLTLSHHSPDLSRLHRLSALVRLDLFDARSVDLTPLVGRELSVCLSPDSSDAAVVGAEPFAQAGGILRRR